MKQRNFFSTGQIRYNPGIDECKGKQHMHISHLSCPVCGGAERLIVNFPFADPSFGISKPCSCMEEQHKILRQQRLRQAANMDAFRDCTFKTFNYRIFGVQEAVRISVAYAIQPHGWLLLVGPCGCGKTHLAAAIANYCMDRGVPVFFITSPDLLDALRAALISSEGYIQLFTWVREVALLILDDLGAQQPSAWSNEKLLQLLDYRAIQSLPTIITALPQEFQGLDERLRSRLTDTQLVTTILFEQVKDFRPFKKRREVKS